MGALRCLESKGRTDLLLQRFDDEGCQLFINLQQAVEVVDDDPSVDELQTIVLGSVALVAYVEQFFVKSLVYKLFDALSFRSQVMNVAGLNALVFLL